MLSAQLSMNEMIKRIHKAHTRQATQQVQHLFRHPDGSADVRTEEGKLLHYKPSNTLSEFHESELFVKTVMGPYGSGKSTGCMFDVVFRACDMPKWKNGRRRSSWIFVRNTSGQLETTTLKTWLTWFGGLGSISKRKKPLMVYEHCFNDGKGLVELEIVFLALDRPDDVAKLKSFEATGAYLNELCELPQSVLSHIKGRVNHRYPSRIFCPHDYWAGVIADSNPPDEDHWMHELFETTKPESHILFKQPPGLLQGTETRWLRNPHADNAENLASDYYLKLAEGQNDEFIKVFCLGKYGLVGTGKRVYPEYNDDVHSRDLVEPIKGVPIHLGWDFGLTPACVVCQISPRGQLLILKEYVSEDMGIMTFAESVVLPGLSQDFKDFKIGISVADPAGNQRDSIMEELSCIGILNKIGIKTHAAETNNLDPRLGAVRYFLNRMVDGQPGIVVSRTYCKVLRRGFVKDYIFKRLAVGGEERYRDLPDKSMSSHPHDGLQYVALELAPKQIAKEKEPTERINMYNPMRALL